MARIRSWLRLILVAKTSAWFVLMAYAGGLFLVGRPTVRARWRRFNLSAWGRMILRIMNVEVEVEGTVPKPPFLLVSNHLSYFDIALLSSLLDTVFVAKSEVKDWPAIGFGVRTMGTIFVDRHRRRDIPRVVAEIERALDAGEGVVLFPEGTSTAGESVAPFRPSLLDPAARAALPVSTAALGYTTPSGEPSAREVVCWWGEMTFTGHFLRMLSLPGFSARVAFGEDAICDPDRKRLAERLETRVRDLFVPVEA